MPRIIVDSNDAGQLRSSGSIGYGFAGIGSESTASLGLSGSINNYTSSLSEVTNDTTSSYDFSHIENALKFLTAKVYETRESVQKIFTGDQKYYGNLTINNPVTGSINGTAGSINGITNTNIVQLAGNQTLTGTKTFSRTIAGNINGNSATTSETTITNTQASAIIANTAKTGVTTTIPTDTAKHVVRLSVTNNRGTYALVITMIDASKKTLVTKTATINLS